MGGPGNEGQGWLAKRALGLLLISPAHFVREDQVLQKLSHHPTPVAKYLLTLRTVPRECLVTGPASHLALMQLDQGFVEPLRLTRLIRHGYCLRFAFSSGSARLELCAVLCPLAPLVGNCSQSENESNSSAQGVLKVQHPCECAKIAQPQGVDSKGGLLSPSLSYLSIRLLFSVLYITSKYPC